MVTRCYLTICAELLKERERLELICSDFGLGHLYPRYEKLPHERNEDIDCRCIELIDTTGHDAEGSSNKNSTKVFIDEWKESAREFSASLLKMVKVLEKAPAENVRNFDSFKRIYDTTRKAMELRGEGEEQVIENRDTMTDRAGNTPEQENEQEPEQERAYEAGNEIKTEQEKELEKEPLQENEQEPEQEKEQERANEVGNEMETEQGVGE